MKTALFAMALLLMGLAVGLVAHGVQNLRQVFQVVQAPRIAGQQLIVIKDWRGKEREYWQTGGWYDADTGRRADPLREVLLSQAVLRHRRVA